MPAPTTSKLPGVTKCPRPAIPLNRSQSSSAPASPSPTRTPSDRRALDSSRDTGSQNGTDRICRRSPRCWAATGWLWDPKIRRPTGPTAARQTCEPVHTSHGRCLNSASLSAQFGTKLISNEPPKLTIILIETAVQIFRFLCLTIQRARIVQH